jgi:hypothetical protein
MLFLSYSWADASVAHQIVHALRTAGLSTWVDVSHLDTDREIEPQLINAISEARFFLHLDSSSSRCSRWVAYERALASALNKTIYDVPPVVALDAVSRLPLSKPLLTVPRAARFLKSMSKEETGQALRGITSKKSTWTGTARDG